MIETKNVASPLTNYKSNEETGKEVLNPESIQVFATEGIPEVTLIKKRPIIDADTRQIIAQTHRRKITAEMPTIDADALQAARSVTHREAQPDIIIAREV